MAILLRLDPAQYFQGQVSVYRGDAWNLTAHVVDQVGSVALAKDLTGAGVTAYFPSTGADPLAVAAVVADGPAGAIRIAVNEDTTPQAGLVPEGTQLYVVVDGIPATGHPFTAQLPDPELAILDRSFQQF